MTGMNITDLTPKLNNGQNARAPQFCDNFECIILFCFREDSDDMPNYIQFG